MPPISRVPRLAKDRPHLGVAARALGVLALLAVLVGVTAWWCLSQPTAAPSLGARPDVALRDSTRGSDEKARRAPQAPWPTQAMRARDLDRSELRLPSMDRPALIPARSSWSRRASWVTWRDRRRPRAAMHEVAPGRAGHRAGNPVRGPPGPPIAST